jgi:hypothetical protein
MAEPFAQTVAAVSKIWFGKSFVSQRITGWLRKIILILREIVEGLCVFTKCLRINHAALRHVFLRLQNLLASACAIS